MHVCFVVRHTNSLGSRILVNKDFQRYYSDSDNVTILPELVHESRLPEADVLTDLLTLLA
jgi:hypothetical protein